MVVQELIKKLQHYCREHPMNGYREVFLRVDGETCYEFGSAVNGDGLADQSYLIFCPDDKGRKFKMREANLQG